MPVDRTPPVKRQPTSSTPARPPPPPAGTSPARQPRPPAPLEQRRLFDSAGVPPGLQDSRLRSGRGLGEAEQPGGASALDTATDEEPGSEEAAAAAAALLQAAAADAEKVVPTPKNSTTYNSDEDQESAAKPSKPAFKKTTLPAAIMSDKIDIPDTEPDGKGLTVEVPQGTSEEFSGLLSRRNYQSRNLFKVCQDADNIYQQEEISTEDLLMLKDLLQQMNMHTEGVERYNAALLDLISQSKSNTKKFLDWSFRSLNQAAQQSRGIQVLLKQEDIEFEDKSKSALPKIKLEKTDNTLDATAIQKDDKDTKADSTKMPKKDILETIKFTGKAGADYREFRENCNNIFGGTTYSYVTKFWCLKQVLPEKFHAQLAGYKKTAEGYGSFWTDMEESYGSNTAVKLEYQQKLKTLPEVTEQNGKISLIKLEQHYSQAKACIRNLESVGMTGKRNHATWCGEMSAKLPMSISRVWAKKYAEFDRDDSKDPVAEYLTFIKAELDGLRTVVTNYKVTTQTAAKTGTKPKTPPKEQTYFTSDRGRGQGRGGSRGRGGRGRGGKSQGPTRSASGTPGTGNAGTTVVSKQPDFCYLCSKGQEKQKHHPHHCTQPDRARGYARTYEANACTACGNIGHHMETCRTKKECPEEGCSYFHMKPLHYCTFLKHTDWVANKSK